MARASLLSLVAETFTMVVAPLFLIQSEAVVLPPCLALFSSLSSLLLYILTRPHLWFFRLLLYHATTLVVTMARNFSVWPGFFMLMFRSVR